MNAVQEIQGGVPTANLLTGLGVDEIFTRTDAAGTANSLADALGSTLALTDAAGTVATQYTYEPFGNTTVSGLPSANPYQYTGRENDGTGFITTAPDTMRLIQEGSSAKTQSDLEAEA